MNHRSVPTGRTRSFASTAMVSMSGVVMPLIAVAKIIKKTFLGTSLAIFNVQWDIFNYSHKL